MLLAPPGTMLKRKSTRTSVVWQLSLHSQSFIDRGAHAFDFLAFRFQKEG